MSLVTHGSGYLLASLLATMTISTANAKTPENHRQILMDVMTQADTKPAIAIHELKQHLSNHPQWHRGRLELARLYYRVGQFRSARKEVKEVVKNASLPKPVKKNILAFYRQTLLAEREKNQQQTKQSPSNWIFSGQLSTTWGYDSNAISGPADQDIGISNVRLRESSLEQSDHFLSTQLLLRADRPLSSGNIKRYKPGYLHWRSLVSLLDRNYNNLNKVDQRNAQLITGLQYQLTKNWQLGTRLRFSHLDYGSSDINYASVEPSVSWRKGKHRVRFGALYTDRNYLPYTAKLKDGNVLEWNLDYSYRPDRQWVLQFNNSVVDADYGLDAYSYRAYESEGRVNHYFNRTLSAWTQLRYRHSKYNADEAPYYSDPRDEEYFTLRVGGRYRLTSDVALELILSGYQNKANHKLHDYDRQQAELKLSWQF